MMPMIYVRTCDTNDMYLNMIHTYFEYDIYLS